MGGRIPEHIVQRAGESPILEIASKYAEMRKDGVNYKGLCPFHDEKTPSFKIHPGKNIYKCFGCGDGGTAIQLVQRMEGLTFPESVEKICNWFGIPFEKQWAGVTEKKQDYYDIYSYAAEFYQGILQPETDNGENVMRHLTNQRGVHDTKIITLSDKAMHYLREKRGLNENTIEEWGLGLALNEWDALMGYLMSRHSISPQEIIDCGLARWNERRTSNYDVFRDRIMIPVRDRRGQVIAFAGRKNPALDKDKEVPKFINSPETRFYKKQNTLFGLYEATEEIRKQKSVVAEEGYFDAIVSHQGGFRNVVALAGTSFTDGHADIISRLTNRVMLCLDADEAGINRTTEIGMKLLEHGLETLVAPLPEGKDPDEVILGDRETFRRVISSPQYLIDFKMDNIEIPEHPDKIIRAINPELYIIANATNSPLLEALYLKSISERFSVKKETLWKDYNLWKESQKNRKRASGSNDWELATLAYLAYSPTERRFAASQLSSEDFSTTERGLLFDFLTHSESIDDVLLKPENSLTDLPLWKKQSETDLKKEFINYCNGMGVTISSGNASGLFAQISSISARSRECIDILRKQKIKIQERIIEKEIKSAVRQGDADKVLELKSQLLLLHK